MALKFIRAIAIALVLPITAFAGPGKTIIFSDIDDTIKYTHVRPSNMSFSAHLSYLWSFAVGVLKSYDEFIGTPSLYMALAANGYEIQYVTGAPKIVSRLPEKFLQMSGFPDGKLAPRPTLDIQTEDFKVQYITKIMLENPDARFMLIGDNGERDVASYHRLQNDPRFAKQIAGVYIHRLYPAGIGMELEEGQRPFLTTADLAIQLYQAGHIDAAQAIETLKVVDNGLRSRFSEIQNQSFPRFAFLDSKDIANLETMADGLSAQKLKFVLKSIIESLKIRVRLFDKSCHAIFI